MRYRSDTSDVPTAYTAVYKTYGGVCGDPERVTSTSNYPGTAHATVSREMYDVVTPNFHRRIANGEIINNPCSIRKLFHSCDAGDVVQRQIHYTVGCTPVQQLWDGWSFEGQIDVGVYLNGSHLPVPAVDSGRVIDLAVTDAWAKANVSDVAGLTTLKESKETVSSLTSIFYRLVRILKAVKRLDVKVLRKEISFKELQARYMEARYAIRPLAYDVVDIITAFNNSVKNNDRLAFRGYATDSSVVSRNDHVCYENTYDKVVSAQISSCTVTARAGILANVENLSKLSIWGLERLPEAVWEIIPYSFIVDWFFNVGKTVSAFTPTGGLRVLASWVTVDTTKTQTSWITGSSAKWPTANIAAKEFTVTGTLSDVEILHERIVNPTLSALPHFSMKMDAPKLLDLAIIAKQLIRG